MARIDRLFDEITARARLEAGEEIPTPLPCRVCEDRPAAVVLTVRRCPDTIAACSRCANRVRVHAVAGGLEMGR